MLIVIKSVWKWRSYLLGKSFTVQTDQKSLKHLLEQRITMPKQARWLPKLFRYDYTVEYKRGSENKAAYTLSPVELSFLSISKPQGDWWSNLLQECATLPFYSSLASNPHAVQRNGVCFVYGKVFLSPSSDLIPHILAECHSSPIRGHFGFHKTLS